MAEIEEILPTLGIPPERVVVVSGLSAPAIATGIAVNRPDLSVWAIVSDEDALTFGGSHLGYVLRRNLSLKIVLLHHGTFDAVPFALATGATFVARAMAGHRGYLTELLAAAAAHDGAALIEIRQGHDGAGPSPADQAAGDRGAAGQAAAEQGVADQAAGEQAAAEQGAGDQGAYGRRSDDLGASDPGPHGGARPLGDDTVRLAHRQPVLFRARAATDAEARAVAGAATGAVVCDPVTGDLRPGGPADARVVVHDAAAASPARAFALSQLPATEVPGLPVGVFRAVRRQSGDALFQTPDGAGRGDLQRLLLTDDITDDN